MAMNERPDAVLVKETLAGDRGAFSVLVRRYEDYAYGVAIGLLSDFELARDVVQEAFLYAYRDLARLKRPDTVWRLAARDRNTHSTSGATGVGPGALPGRGD